MNPIFQANVQAIIDKKQNDITAKIGKPIQENSTSRKIIEYLFDNGETDGRILAKEFNLKNSPYAYIQPHIKRSRIFCTKINHYNVTYRINEHLTKKDFGI